MAVALRVFDEAGPTTELLDRATILTILDDGNELVDYLLVAPVTTTPSIDPIEDAILAWKEASGLFYDHNAERRTRLIELARARGDLAALSILGA